MNLNPFVLAVYAYQTTSPEETDLGISTVLRVPCDDIRAGFNTACAYLDDLFPTGHTITYIEVINANKVSDSNTYVHGK